MKIDGWTRYGAWSAAILAGALIGLLVWSYAAPPSAGFARRSIALQNGNVEFARASHPFRRDQRSWFFATAQPARLILGAGSSWRPSMSSGSMTVGTLAMPRTSTTITLDVVFVPIWTWAAALTGASAFLFWHGRRIVAPGHCRGCGYNLRGLPAGRCPECGFGASLVSAVLNRIRGALALG